MKNKEVRRGRNHNQWERRIAAGYEGVVDYKLPNFGKSQFFADSSVSWQPLRVCELSAIAFLLHTSIIVKNKNIILYLYIYVFLVVHKDTTEYTTYTIWCAVICSVKKKKSTTKKQKQRLLTNLVAIGENNEKTGRS